MVILMSENKVTHANTTSVITTTLTTITTITVTMVATVILVIMLVKNRMASMMSNYANSPLPLWGRRSCHHHSPRPDRKGFPSNRARASPDTISPEHPYVYGQ